MSEMLIHKPLGREGGGGEGSGRAAQGGGARGGAIKVGVQHRQYELCASVGEMVLTRSTFGNQT